MLASDEIRYLIIATEDEIEHWLQLKAQVADTLTRLPEGQPDIHDTRSVAMLLTEIYLGAENLMRQVAKRLDETIPTGSAWHQELLTQLSTEAPEIRPALFSASTRMMLDEFRRFRHVVHHAYAVVFDWPQMSKLLSQAGSLLDGMIADAQAFKDFLYAASADES
jgi:hypothetical protein